MKTFRAQNKIFIVENIDVIEIRDPKSSEETYNIQIHTKGGFYPTLTYKTEKERNSVLESLVEIIKK